jgi:hypothetical protein
MKILKNLLIKSSLLLMIALPLSMTAPAYAADAPCGDNCSSGAGAGSSGNTSPVASTACNNTEDAKGGVSQTKVNKCLNQSALVKDIQTIVNFLSAAVGVVIIAMLIVGGIQYSLAGDNASALTAARQRITNAVIALFAFLFAWAFLQWLIPGGIF